MTTCLHAEHPLFQFFCHVSRGLSLGQSHSGGSKQPAQEGLMPEVLAKDGLHLEL